MVTVRVRNIRSGEQGVYIGRRIKDLPRSPLANDERMGDESRRAKVIRMYHAWLWEKMQANDQAVMDELHRLLDLARRPEGVKLLCWCYPKACHGDVIAKALAWLDKQEQVRDGWLRKQGWQIVSEYRICQTTARGWQ